MKGTLLKRNRVNERALKSASRHFMDQRCLNSHYRPPRGRYYVFNYDVALYYQTAYSRAASTRFITTQATY